MWDNFNIEGPIDFIEFQFVSKRFEVYENKQIIDSGFSGNLISLSKKNDKGIIWNSDDRIKKYVSTSDSLEFDYFYPMNDRLILINLPDESLSTDNCQIFLMMKQMYGPTRNFKNFNSNEPWICSLFLQQSIIKKISFQTCNPERLIEFYS